MRILFVDQAFHKKTKSADFFIDLLRSEFEVEIHYYDETYHANIPYEKIERADLIISWEFLLGRKNLIIPGKPCVYIPMYDWDWGSRAQWRRLSRSGVSVISFCDKVTRWAFRAGFNSERVLPVHFAYDPQLFDDYSGNPDICAIWDRGFFGFSTLRNLFPPKFFQKIILIRRQQPGLVYEPIAQEDIDLYNIEIHESDFLPRDEYLRLLKEPGVFIAPRPKEGIGMSFLEQLAMGKCVIVHDDATMNEYVVDGLNGFIRDLNSDTCAPISKEQISFVRMQVREYAKRQYVRWQKDRCLITDFIKCAAKHPMRVGGITDFFLRTVLLFEALYARLLP